MKKILFFTVVLISGFSNAQDVRLLKGAITENVVVNDSLGETFSVYLPTYFDLSRPWPVLLVFDLEGKGKSALSMLSNAAEKEGFILASSDNTNDSLSISQNVLISNRMFNNMVSLVPIAKNQSYAAGFKGGAKFASILPTFIKEVKGVVSIGAPVGNIEILNPKSPFKFIGIVNRNDFNFREMEALRDVLDRLKFPNQLLVFDGEQLVPDQNTLASALRILKLNGMAKNEIVADPQFIQESFDMFLAKSNSFLSNGTPVLAEYLLSDMKRIFNPLMDLDSIKKTEKSLRRSSSYKQANRSQNNYFLKEDFTKEDYAYYLEEDILTYNYPNLGWWKYQMEELDKLDKSKVLYERQMASRLRGYINALVEDNIDFIAADKTVDVEALNFLYMLKTIIAPKDFDNYLKIISNSSRIEDYGTALFYLEELLKNGYTNKKQLYELPDTALFRITPEFNMMVEKYLKEARYEVIEQ